MYIHLTLASLAFAVGVAFLIPGHGVAAVLTCAIAASAAGLLIKRAADGPFLCQVFIAALLVRVAVASFIFVFELHAYFGGDAITYDELGREVLSYWRGGLSRELYEANIQPQLNKNWGMVYVTAAIYGAVGHNILAVQLFNSAVCSPVGVNSSIIRDGENGFVAATEEEWLGKLTRLLRSPSLRDRLGGAGRATVEVEYSLSVHAPRVYQVLQSAVASRACAGRSPALPAH